MVSDLHTIIFVLLVLAALVLFFYYRKHNGKPSANGPVPNDKVVNPTPKPLSEGYVGGHEGGMLDDTGLYMWNKFEPQPDLTLV